MSNLSELLPSGGGQNVVEFTASGAVASGKPVILNSNGTVTEVGTISESTGSEVVFESAATYYISGAYDTTNNKIVLAYQDQPNSNYGTAIVGTVSGTSISFGTPVVFESANVEYTSVVYDPDTGKIVIAYRDQGNSSYGTAIVGTVSGTSISFGTAVVFQSTNSFMISTTYDTTNDKVVIAYSKYDSWFKGFGVVGTVSGTSISFGTPVRFDTDNTAGYDIYYNSAVFDSSNGKVVISYRGNNVYGQSVVGTVSGTSISFGTPVNFKTASVNYVTSAYDSTNNKVAIIYNTVAGSGEGIVGTVSGTSISFGSSTSFMSGSSGAEFLATTFDSTNGKTVSIYRDSTNSNYGTYVVGTVSGTSISFGTPTVFNTASSNDLGIAFDSSEGICVFGYRDFGNSNYGTAICLQNETTNLTAASFIGLAAGAISDTATGNINVKGGINEVQTGLTIGSDYYVQTDGTLATTADTPSVKVGQAISATTINMMDLT
jgi:hypothetical protein